MKRLTLILLCAALVALNAFGQNGTPSAKAAAYVRSLECAYPEATSNYDKWTNVGAAITIKTNNVNDLFIGASFETGLYTLTRVSTKLDASGVPLTSTAEAMAGIQFRALIDGVESAPVAPGPVTFDQRIQTLSAKLGQALTGCTINDLGFVQCTGLTDQEIQLVLDTLGAHAFNFVKTNVGVGVHTLQLQYKLNKNADASSTTSTNVSKACVGLGTVTVESVRMANYIELQ